LTFRVADPDRRYAAVRLSSDLPLDGSFRRDGDDWVLHIDPPGIARLEYKLELQHLDGTTETVLDPENPQRAPGVFGEKSVMLTERYESPAWLDAPGVEGHVTELSVRGRGLGASVHARVWDSGGGPLLVAHDGPEYDRLAALTHFAASGIASGALPRHRVALLAPGERNEWYSASARYAGALVRDVVPALRSAVAVAGPVVGMGASLGGLAMLHAQRRHPGTFGGLFLQSGSFFTPQFDAQESGFPRYQRIVRFVRETLRERPHPDPVPTALTCGSAEENVDNNRVMARALWTQGYPAVFHEVPDMHNYTAWRDAFDPHLSDLLARAW
jgi:enterochelin esterase family protein